MRTNRKLLTAEQAGKVIGVSADTIHDLGKLGLIPVYKLGSSSVFLEDDVRQTKTRYYADGWTVQEIAARYGKDRKRLRDLLRKTPSIGQDRRRGGVPIYNPEAVRHMADLLGWKEEHE